MRGMIGWIQARVDVQKAYKSGSMLGVCISGVERTSRKDGPMCSRRHHRYFGNHVRFIIQTNFRETLGILFVSADCCKTDIQIGSAKYFDLLIDRGI